MVMSPMPSRIPAFSRHNPFRSRTRRHLDGRASSCSSQWLPERRQAEQGSINSVILDGIGDIYHAKGSRLARQHGERQQKYDLACGNIFPLRGGGLYRLRALREAGGLTRISSVESGGRRSRIPASSGRATEPSMFRSGRSSRGAASAGGQSDLAAYHGYRNPVWVFVKNMSPLSILPVAAHRDQPGLPSGIRLPVP